LYTLINNTGEVTSKAKCRVYIQEMA